MFFMYVKSTADVLFLHREYERAAALFLEGAEGGDAGASYNYGYCLLHGIGVEKNPALAKSFFGFARYMEGGEACYQLAMLYLHGVGIERNYKTAVEYMRESAERGCVEAQLYMGVLYTTGCVFEPDVSGILMIPFHKPEYRDRTLALVGDIPDLAEDEELRFSVVTADSREAFEWFRTAAHHDSTYAQELVAKGQYLYAKCFIDGMGTEINRDRGERLMLAAGKSGSAEAVAYLQENGVTVERLLAAAKRDRNRG